MNAIELTTDEPASEESQPQVSRWAYRTSKQKEIDAEKALSRAWPARPLPEGKTWQDVLREVGRGNETDEQVTEALREMS